MTDDTDPDDHLRLMEIRRLATLLIGSVEIILFLLFVHLMLMSVDPLHESIGVPKILFVAIPILALTLPGLLLAWLGRAPRLALGLVIAAVPAALLVWV